MPGESSSAERDQLGASGKKKTKKQRKRKFIANWTESA